MRRSRIIASAMLAYIAASVPAVALNDQPVRHDPPPPRPPRPRIDLEREDQTRSEIAAHNEAVERRKAAKLKDRATRKAIKAAKKRAAKE